MTLAQGSVFPDEDRPNYPTLIPPLTRLKEPDPYFNHLIDEILAEIHFRRWRRIILLRESRLPMGYGVRADKIPEPTM